MGKSTHITRAWKSGVQFFDVSGRTPVLCEVRRVAKGVVYYRSIDSDGPKQRSNLAEFEQIAVRIVSVQTDDESDVFSIQPDDMHRLILKALENGASYAEVGELIGLDAMRVRRIARRLGFKIKVEAHQTQKERDAIKRKAKLQARNDREKLIIELLQSGSTLAEIGRKFNISRARVGQIALKIGINITQLRDDKYKQRQQAVIDALRSGMKPDEVVTSFHMHKNTVNAIAKMFGFEIEKDIKKNAVLKMLRSVNTSQTKRVGVIYEEIANAVGATKGYVHRTALDAGIRKHAFVTRLKRTKRDEQVRKAIAKAHEIK